MPVTKVALFPFGFIAAHFYRAHSRCVFLLCAARENARENGAYHESSPRIRVVEHEVAGQKLAGERS